MATRNLNSKTETRTQEEIDKEYELFCREWLTNPEMRVRAKFTTDK